MTDQAIALSLNALLSGFLLFRFVNARQRRKITTRQSSIAWGALSTIYFFLLLSVDTVEAAVDTQFGSAPVTTLLRCLLILGALHLYLLAVRHDLVRNPSREHIFLRLNPITAVIILALFGWSVSTRLIPHDALALLMKGVRDLTVTTWCAFILLPLHLRWFHAERVRPMKLMYAMNFACYTALLVQSVSTVGIALGVVRHTPVDALYPVERASTYLFMALLFTLIFPFSWLTPVFYPRPFRTYLKLRRLERIVRRWALEPPLLEALPLNLAHPDAIDLAIYQKVLMILDMLPTLTPNPDLQARIQQQVDPQKSYSELVKSLTEVHL